MGVAGWTRGPAIGRGSSATVSIAVDRRTGGVLAVKSVCADRAAELRRERAILRGLSSPYVVRCLDAEDRTGAGGGLDMLMEYAPGGSLADEIRRCGGRCAEGLVRSRARDILRGLAHVHAAGVAHGDVKPRNVLIGSDGRALIADFGCARITAGEGRRPTGGTPMFMAPEAARGEEQGPEADIWAVGCTVIEMATGAGPWQRFASAAATLHHVAFSGEAPELPQCLSDQGKDFLGRCLQQDPSERWTAEQLLEHEFVAVDAAAAASTSNSMPAVTEEKATFVSPKSVLDQAMWDDEDDTAADTANPTDRVRALAAGAPAVPDWTWDASWITVHAGPSGAEPTMPPEQPETGAEEAVSRDSTVGDGGSDGGSAGASNSSQEASHGNGYDGYDGTGGSCNGDDGNHVVSCDCTVPTITGNGFFSDILLCPVLLVPPSQPSWLWPVPFTVPLLLVLVLPFLPLSFFLSFVSRLGLAITLQLPPVPQLNTARMPARPGPARPANAAHQLAWHAWKKRASCIARDRRLG